MSESESPVSSSFDPRDFLKLPLGQLEKSTFTLLPVGWYFADCTDIDLEGFSPNTGTACWVFYCRPTEPGPDLKNDPAAMKILSTIDLSNFEFPRRGRYQVNAGTIWLSPKSQSNIREFFENMGFNPAEPIDPTKMLGKKVVMYLDQEEGTQTNLDGTTRKYNVFRGLIRDPREKD